MDIFFDKQFQLRYFEMNDFGIASPTTILTLLEETAADHCHSIGYSLYDLKKQNIGWVLLSGLIQMDRYPKYKETITIRTWLSSFTAIRGYRENIIFDEYGTIIGRARGLWLFFDIEKRRPTPIFDDIVQKWSFKNELSIDRDITNKIEPVHSSGMTRRFPVNKFDVDAYDHVNNIRYLAWLIESMPKEITDHYFLHSIDGRFTAEAQYGNTMVSFTRKGADDFSYVHSIKMESNDTICASAQTVWKKYSERM